jgi:small subunit ribosomal protein S16
MRMGKKKQPTYRVVAADARSPRDGRFIEIVGTYDPRPDPSTIKIDNERAVHWLRHGAQPTERVAKLLKISGAWTDFTGEAPPPVVTVAGSATVTEKPAEAPAEEAPVVEEAPVAEAPAAEPVPVLEDATVDSDADGEANATDVSPFGDASALPLEDGSAPGDEYTIKGNAGSMLYHPPSSPFYGRTKAEVWFTTAEAAEAAGFSLPPSLQDDHAEDTPAAASSEEE